MKYFANSPMIFQNINRQCQTAKDEYKHESEHTHIFRIFVRYPYNLKTF